MFGSYHLSGHDHVSGNLDVQEKETEVTNVSKGTQGTLLGVTASVAVAVSDASEAPDQSKSSGSSRVTKTGNEERDHVRGKALQGVLMNTLLAVEDHLLLVLQGLGLIGVHVRERNTSDLAVTSDADTETGDENGGEDRHGDGLIEKSKKSERVV